MKFKKTQIAILLAVLPAASLATTTPQQELMIMQYEKQIVNANRTIAFFGIQLEELIAAQNNYLNTGGTLNTEDTKVAYEVKELLQNKERTIRCLQKEIVRIERDYSSFLASPKNCYK
jgi:hypothetical protein